MSAFIEVDGVEWCSVHSGIRNEDGPHETCDLFDAEHHGARCQFRPLFVAPATDYDDATSCPICPMVATDRDDALREAQELRKQLDRAELILRHIVVNGPTKPNMAAAKAYTNLAQQAHGSAPAPSPIVGGEPVLSSPATFAAEGSGEDGPSAAPVAAGDPDLPGAGGVSVAPPAPPAAFNESEPERPTWKHSQGDRYLALTRYPKCRDGGPIWYELTQLGSIQPTLALAKRDGFAIAGCDDFNIAVIRNRWVVAWLWMDKVIDEDAAFLDEITTEVFG